MTRRKRVKTGHRRREWTRTRETEWGRGREKHQEGERIVKHEHRFAIGFPFFLLRSIICIYDRFPILFDIWHNSRTEYDMDIFFIFSNDQIKERSMTIYVFFWWLINLKTMSMNRWSSHVLSNLDLSRPSFFSHEWRSLPTRAWAIFFRKDQERDPHFSWIRRFRICAVPST